MSCPRYNGLLQQCCKSLRGAIVGVNRRNKFDIVKNLRYPFHASYCQDFELPFCVECGRELPTESSFCPNCGNRVTEEDTKRHFHIPLKTEHLLLLGISILTVVFVSGLPLAYAPQKTATVATIITPYSATSTRYETKSLTSSYTFTFTTTSRYTTTETVIVYIPTIVGGGGGYYYGEVTTIWVPVQVEETHILSAVVRQTSTLEQRHIFTETQYSVTHGISTAEKTETVPLSSAIVSSYKDYLTWIILVLIFPFLAYHRINAYRTRLHIYYEILHYASGSPKLPSHIMRACNLETRKFESYVRTLREKGYVDEIREDGGRLYRTSDRGWNMIRDEKLTEFMRELP